jgi:hypothetical protein
VHVVERTGRVALAQRPGNFDAVTPSVSVEQPQPAAFAPANPI